jgi:hypothetical protein
MDIGTIAHQNNYHKRLSFVFFLFFFGSSTEA